MVETFGVQWRGIKPIHGDETCKRASENGTYYDMHQFNAAFYRAFTIFYRIVGVTINEKREDKKLCVVSRLYLKFPDQLDGAKVLLRENCIRATVHVDTN